MTTPDTKAVLIATTDGVEDTRVADTLGVAIGIAIRSRGVVGNIMAGLEAFGNGSALVEYRDLLLEVRREALMQMEQSAGELGANAVIGTRFDSAEVGHEMVEVVAYGTAVVLEPTL